MANDHLLDLHETIDIARTHVVLTDFVQWRKLNQISLERDRFQELFDLYRNAWVSNNIADLTALYSSEALPSSIRYAGVASTKKVSSPRTNAKPQISPQGINLDSLANVSASNITLISNPDKTPEYIDRHMVMEFELEDVTNATVTLFWEKSSGGFWQIKREVFDAKGA